MLNNLDPRVQMRRRQQVALNARFLIAKDKSLWATDH